MVHICVTLDLFVLSLSWLQTFSPLTAEGELIYILE